MSTIHARVTVGLLLALVTGCAASTTPEESDGQSATASATQGLTIDAATSGPSQVVGSFTRDEATVTFLFRREGDVRFARLADASGRTIVETEERAGVETSKLLGGRLLVTGAIGSDAPTYDGDLRVRDELSASPEARLVGPLKEALSRANVDRTLFASTGGPSGNVKPMGRLANVTLDAKQWVDVPTWSFWATSRISMIEMSGCRTWVDTLTAQGRKDSYLIQNNTRTVYGQWWGFAVRVTNQNIWVGCQVRVDAD